MPLTTLISSAWAQESTVNPSLTPAAAKAAALGRNFATHALGLPSANRQAQWIAGKPANAIAAAKGTFGPPARGYYPADLSDGFNGPTLTSAVQHDLYVNGTPSVWGSP